MSTLFRESTNDEAPRPNTEEPEPNIYGSSSDVEDIRPVEGDQDILKVLGVVEDLKVLPEEDYQDLQELKSYLHAFMEEKGLSQTMRGLRNGLEALKEQMGLHKEADPQAIIKKIGSVAKAWKGISFIRDLSERKKILERLVMADSPKEMDEIVFEEMRKKEVWR